MPEKRDFPDPPEIQDGNRSSEKKRGEGYDPEVHDKGLSKNGVVGYLLEHGLYTTLTEPLMPGLIMSV